MAFNIKPVPVSVATTSAAQSAALSVDGMEAVGVTNVIGALEGSSELVVTIRNTTGEPIENVVMLPGVQSTAVEAALPAGIQMSVEGFGSAAAFQAYFAHVSTNVSGFTVESSNTANLNNTLLFSVKKPDGQSKEVRKKIGGFRQALGGGSYAETLVVDPRVFGNILIWAALKMSLARIEANSEIIFNFNVNGWNAGQGLSTFAGNTL